MDGVADGVVLPDTDTGGVVLAVTLAVEVMVRESLAVCELVSVGISFREGG